MEAVRGQFEKKEKVNFSFLCDLNCFFPVCVKLSKKKKKKGFAKIIFYILAKKNLIGKIHLPYLFSHVFHLFSQIKNCNLEKGSRRKKNKTFQG